MVSCTRVPDAFALPRAATTCCVLRAAQLRPTRTRTRTHGSKKDTRIQLLDDEEIKRVLRNIRPLINYGA